MDKLIDYFTEKRVSGSLDNSFSDFPTLTEKEEEEIQKALSITKTSKDTRTLIIDTLRSFQAELCEYDEDTTTDTMKVKKLHKPAQEADDGSDYEEDHGTIKIKRVKPKNTSNEQLDEDEEQESSDFENAGGTMQIKKPKETNPKEHGQTYHFQNDEEDDASTMRIRKQGSNPGTRELNVAEIDINNEFGINAAARYKALKAKINNGNAKKFQPAREDWELKILALERGEWLSGMENDAAFRRWKRNRPRIRESFYKQRNSVSIQALLPTSSKKLPTSPLSQMQLQTQKQTIKPMPRNATVPHKRDQQPGIARQRSSSSDMLVTIPFTETKLDERDHYYTDYLVVVEKDKFRWVVNKRYSEFYQLYEEIEKLKPTIQEPIVLPEFPPKRLIGKMLTDFIEERRQVLERWLLGVSFSRTLCTTKPVHRFFNFDKLKYLQDRYDENLGLYHIEGEIHQEEDINLPKDRYGPHIIIASTPFLPDRKKVKLVTKRATGRQAGAQPNQVIWKYDPIFLDVKACGGLDSPLFFECYSSLPNGEPSNDVIGGFIATLSVFENRLSGHPFPLINDDKRSWLSGTGHGGLFYIRSCSAKPDSANPDSKP